MKIAKLSRFSIVGLVLAGLLVTPGASDAQNQLFDHLTCHKMRDSQTIVADVILDGLRAEFDPGRCKVKGRGLLFCTPTEKTVLKFELNGEVTDPLHVPGPAAAPDRICYKVRCKDPIVPTSILASDQFGSRKASAFSVRMLCTPAVIGPPPSDDTCGDNDDCASDHYCHQTDGTCAGDGTCKPKPTACPDVYDPVCGCDGLTYGNVCEIAAAGVNVASNGVCPPATCSDNSECTSDEYCEKADGDCGGTGLCAAKPIACPDVYDPICACDGRDYANACDAAGAGTNVETDGVCGS